MKQTTNYYDLLEIAPYADLAEISAAYLRLSRELAAGDGALPPGEAELRRQLLKHAWEVLANPSRRAEYDASLGDIGGADHAMHRGLAADAAKWSPIRRLLTVIASLMVIGMTMQIVGMFTAYRQASAVIGANAVSPAADKVFLQDFYQTYGIRAANRAEAELLLADMHRKEAAEREERRLAQSADEQERKQRRFEEESRRIGAEVSANLQQAEREAERAREEEFRRKEAKEQAEKAAERARLEREINRFRGRSGAYGE